MDNITQEARVEHVWEVKEHGYFKEQKSNSQDGYNNSCFHSNLPVSDHNKCHIQYTFTYTQQFHKKVKDLH